MAAVALAPAVNLLAQAETPCVNWAEFMRACDQIQLSWLRVQEAIAKAQP